jgi:hypothetical protein
MWIETIMANKTTNEVEALVEDREEEVLVGGDDLGEGDSDSSRIESE